MPQEPHHRPIARHIRSFAKRMRDAPTDAEATMWRLLRDRRLSQYKFRRQVPFENYILDFVCFERRLVIEVDGGRHASSSTDEVSDEVLAAAGFTVARYWNNDVLQRRAEVMEDILAKLAERRETPHPAPSAPPSPARGEGAPRPR
jgi:very-short-patch-repair endonuclease